MGYRLDQAMENALVAWARAGLGEDFIVRWDSQDAVATGTGRARREITLPYATLSFLSGPSRVGAQADQDWKSTDVYTISHVKQFTLNVTVYAKEQHLALMQGLINSIDIPSKNSILIGAGLANWGSEDPVDLSVLLDTKHELRSACDFFFSYATEIDDAVGEIQDVNAQGLIGDIVVSIGIDT